MIPRIEIRELHPQLKSSRPSKAILGDPFEVSVIAIRDGHGQLRCDLQWRHIEPAPESQGDDWVSTPMALRDSGRFVGEAVFAELGMYEFKVRSWLDRFSSWRHDLSIRAQSGEPLDQHFEIGARLLEDQHIDVPQDEQARISAAVTGLRDTRCNSSVRLAAGLDDAVAEVVASVPDTLELTESDSCFVRCERELAIRGAWYEFFPRSEGGFNAGASSFDRLPEIAAAGFDVVYLPPVHPIGSTHRKGKNNALAAGPRDVGSPWAIGSDTGGHQSIHPDLGTLDDFDLFVNAAGDEGLEVALDFALQCSPDHPWVTGHPEWFFVRPDGSIQYAENPPKKYEDIYPINFWPESAGDRVSLWQACAGILEFWISHGVKVFRVDNPHTKPIAFWEWLIEDIQSRHPEVVFLAEAFTDVTMMHTLAEVGFSQSYTYFTWRHSGSELQEYAQELAHGDMAQVFRPNLWPNTPDILNGPLRNGLPAAFKIRALLAATLSPSWGIYSGYELCENEPASSENTEYLNSEKYESRERDWARDDSLMPWIAKLNRIRDTHPSTHRLSRLTFHGSENPDVLAYSYAQARDQPDVDRLLVIVNLSPTQANASTIYLNLESLHLSDGEAFEVFDELDGISYNWTGSTNYVDLDPGQRVAHVLSIRS